jgi:hypothetical protein
MAVIWTVRDRNVIGNAEAAASGSGPVLEITWGLDSEAPNPFPWAPPKYPCFLLLGLSFTLFTVGIAITRRPRLTVAQPLVNGVRGTTILPAVTGIGATNNRKYEWWAGYAMDTPAVGTLVSREPLPEGLILLSSANPLTGCGFIRLNVDNGQSVDSFSNITITGMLLL